MRSRKDFFYQLVLDSVLAINLKNYPDHFAPEAIPPGMASISSRV